MRIHYNAIKDDVHTITQLFWEVEVTQGNENECWFNKNFI